MVADKACLYWTLKWDSEMNSEMRTVVFQNRLALDIIIASQGVTCVIVQIEYYVSYLIRLLMYLSPLSKSQEDTNKHPEWSNI